MKSLLLAFALLGGCTLSGSATIDPQVECTKTCETNQEECVTTCKKECVDAGGNDTDTACDEDCETTCTEEYDTCSVKCESTD